MQATKRLLNGVAREPCLVVDATTLLSGTGSTSRERIAAARSRSYAPRCRPRPRGPTCSERRPCPRPPFPALPLLKPRCSRPPLSVSLSLSSLPTLSPRGSRRRQRLRRRSRKLQPSPASARRRPGNKSCSACSLPSSSVDLGSREVSDSGKGGS